MSQSVATPRVFSPCQLLCCLALAYPVLAALAGCSEEGVRCYPVTGKVMQGEKPVAEAAVVFHPQHADAHAVKPVATTDADGRFSLTTLKTGDGAPPGDYVVTVELRELREVGEELVRDGRNLLPVKYARPETSDLRVTVDAGANDVGVLRLSER